MSNTKTVMSQAANTLVKPLNVEEVFSTYLYEGNGSTQTITNGIDLDGEGGLTWLKMRDTSSSTARQYHFLYDTERGSGKRLSTNLTDAEAAFEALELTSFNSNGFSLGSSARINETSKDYASWTFRKAPKFFDVVTYTGTGNNVQTVQHNLGTTVGSIIVKSASSDKDWHVWHKGLPNAAQSYMYLNYSDGAYTATDIWGNTAPTDTQFTVGTNSDVNGLGITYVAYLFAHNDGDGGFGADGDADIIKCGSYTGNGSSTGPEIDLGFEPQWVLVKCATAGGSSPAYEWYLMDTMRGMTGESDTWITVNSPVAESTATYSYVKPEPNGFKIQSGQSRVNASGETYIYIAIRRGTKVPESATEVFGIDIPATGVAAPTYASSFPVDMALGNREFGSTGDTRAATRLTGTGRLFTNSTGAESADGDYTWDFMDGYYQSPRGNSTFISWMWKRAPGFFDVVAYSGDGVAGRTVSHNLGVAPEMMWVKNRDSSADSWTVYASSLGATQHMVLNNTNASSDAGGVLWNYTEPTDTVFTVGNNNGVNGSGSNIIAYLFASLDGISKVGSYTGNGTSQTIDCGFTSGARFVLIKETSGTSPWHVFDTERGIVAGNDPRLKLDNTGAQTTTQDFIDPAPSGFAVTSSSITNGSGDEYIFYAIA